MFKRRLLATTLMFGLATGSWANQFSDAIDHYNQQNYSQAYSLFHDLAQKEHAQAQLNLAVLIAKGDGILQSDKDALYWAWRARFSGAAEAIDVIAYLTPKTLPEDRQDNAHKLRFAYSERFEQGDLQAAFNMARTFNEVYAPKDIEQAYVWFTISTALDLKYAKAFRETLGVPLDVGKRAKLQKDAQTILTQWCLRNPDAAASLCANMITSGS